MRIKYTVPYILFGLAGLFGRAHASTQQNNTNSAQISVEYRLGEYGANDTYTKFQNDSLLDNKATKLCDAYIANMVRAQKKLAPLRGHREYAAAVRKELPGAPVGRHCVYGQYTQLGRAQDALGDTSVIVPKQASRSCKEFRTVMKEKYSDNGQFKNCIYHGKMFASYGAFDDAMKKYLVKRGICAKTAPAVRQRCVNQFKEHNFVVDDLRPGTMMIVPRYRGCKTSFHMIMYMGRGILQDGEFTPMSDGQPVYIAHNSERIGYLFEQWDASNVFAANTWQICRTIYEQELAKIWRLDTEQLIDFLSDNPDVSSFMLHAMSLGTLKKLALDKYFNQQEKLRKDYRKATWDRYNNMIKPMTTQLDIIPDIKSDVPAQITESESKPQNPMPKNPILPPAHIIAELCPEERTR